MIRAAVLGLALLLPGAARAAELQVLSAGAYKAVLLAAAPGFAAKTGHTLSIRNETAGVAEKAIRDGAVADYVVLPPANIRALSPLVGDPTPLARVGIGVAVAAGAPKPDIATPEAFRATVLAARAPAWIDPAAGGSSGIYLQKLWEQWGIAGRLAPKAVLVPGGLVADRIASGQADLALQQISELIGVAGVQVVGPLPEPIQNYTVYAGTVPLTSRNKDAARQLADYLAGPEGAAVLAERGMVPP